MKAGEKLRYILLTAILIIVVKHSATSSNVKFYSINNMYGISMRESNSVLKDNNGFIWASSKTGVLRLTDDDYKIYQLQYKYPNVVTVKLAFKGNTFLAYANNGQIYKFNEIGDKFDLFVDLRQTLNDVFIGINSLLIINDDCFWIATTTGFVKYEDGKLSRIDDGNIGANCPVLLNDDTIIYARGNEVVRLDIKTQAKSVIFPNSDLQSLDVSVLFVDSVENRLWIGTTTRGLFSYNLTNGEVRELNNQYFPKQPILAIASISKNSLLIGIDGQGIWEVDKKGEQILNIYKENDDNPASLQGNGVYDIFCEDNKRVWVCTYSGGVSYFELSSPLLNHITHQLNNPNSLANNNVNSIIESSDGEIWFATNNGISCWNVAKDQWRNFYVNKKEQAQVFLTLCEDNDGRIWAGTYSSGVYVLDGKSGKELAHYSNQEKGSPFVNDFVFDIYKDSKGDIWIGGINSEVVCYHAKENTFQKYPSQALYTMAEYNPNQMLFGCVYGLVLSENKTGNSRILKDGLIALDLFVQDSIVWIATSGFGLVKYNIPADKIEKFTVKNGLPSNYISSIAYSDSFLWVGTENGLCRFDPKSYNVVVYSSIEPLSKVSFNHNARCKLSNGLLAFGTNKGAIIYNPKTIQEFQSKGNIYFQDLSISGRSVRDIASFKLKTPLNHIEDLKLRYNQNTITIELLPIGVTSGSKFSWKLEGFDNDWTQPSNHRLLSYSNIPNKKYQLKIRLYDNSLSQILAERNLNITITPPFWGTWWFLIIVFVVVSFVILFTFWNYINQLKQRHTVEKVKFFTNTAHDLRTSLTLIKAPVEELNKENNLTESGRHYLSLALEQTRRLSSVINQLMDFQKVDIGKDRITLAMVDVVALIKHRYNMFESLAQSKNLKFEFTTNTEQYETAIDESQIEKVIDNLISNAIKYSFPDTIIYLQFKGNNIQWSLEVKDNGIGTSKKEQRSLFKEFYRAENAINSKVVGSGIGLLLIKNYVELHGGTVSFSSQENVGSTFQISIPYKRVEVETSNVVTENVEIQNYVNQQADNQESILQQSSQDQKDTRILIVEDNEELRGFMVNVLSSEFEVHYAENGILAWEIIQKMLPDLVVSDIMMPEMDGFELCQLLKSTYETSHIPIILLTALTEKTEQVKGLGLGADDYLTKPFDMVLLNQKIKSIIQNRELVREKALKLIKPGNNEPILNNELNDAFVKKMVKVVHENMSNTEFGKTEFALAMNVSSSLLYKKVKALTDISPSDFIKTVRLDYSLELLQSRKYNITEISEMCGFASLRYFSSVFKKHFGKTPTDILK